MDSYGHGRVPDRGDAPPAESRFGVRDEFARSTPEDTYRRRSPGPENRRPPRPRNRSRSPVAIDRYQPDPRSSRDDYYGGRRDDRRRAPSPNGPANIDRYVPGQEPSNNSVMERLVQDPFKLEYQVGFSYFGEWWRQEKNIKEDRERQRSGSRRPPQRIKGEAEVREEREKEKSQIQVAYDAYKETLQVKMARSFVQAHKGDEWFKERYIPEVRDGIRQQLAKVRVSNYSQWEKDFDAGLFDEFTLEGIYKSESNGVGGVLEKEEGETTATAEVLGVGDLVPLKGGDPPDETAQQPTLLIKTIAPSVSRAKLEEFCIENLGDTDGGFKSLSLSDPNPSKRYHRIGWVMLKPELSTGIAAERGDGRDEEKEAMDEGASTSNGVEEKIQTTTEKALEAINAKTIVDEVRGDFTVHVGVHNPSSLTRKKALWDLFSSPERIDKDLNLAMRVVAKLEEEINAGFEGLAKIEEKVDGMVSNGLLRPPTPEVSGADKPKKSRYELDMDVDGGDVEEGEEDEMDEDEGAIDEEEKDDEEMLIKKKKLDLIVEYLRRVFNFCFFCVFESDSVHELMRKCPGGHLRRPRASLSTSAKRAAVASALGEPFPMKKDSMEDQDADVGSPTQKFSKFASKNTQQLQRAFNWVKTYEEKLMQFLEPENVDLKKIGGKPVDEALEEELEKFVKQEDENKFRCKVPECTKLFKGVGFWRKHVEKRHPEWFGSLKQDLILVNTYVLDPSHIAPSRSDANSNGHFPPANNAYPAGTPRGFSLQNMPLSFGAILPGMGGPGAFPPFFGPHAVTAPGQWGNSSFNGSDRQNSGPVRRGGANNRYARPGPYDRRPRDGRDNRWGNGTGRSSPPRNNGGRAPSGGRWGDGAGGAAVGPREAVQGRSLKSYEDLDAVGGGGSGELNY